MKNSVIIDAHTHPAGPAIESVEDYTTMEKLMLEKQAEAERVESILKLMDKYGVDQAIGLISLGISILPDENEKIIKVAQEYPDRFPAVMVGFSMPPVPGDLKGEDAAREIESYLKIPQVKGVGEWAQSRGSLPHRDSPLPPPFTPPEKQWQGGVVRPEGSVFQQPRLY